MAALSRGIVSARTAEIGFADHLVVRDHHGDIGFAADREALLETVEHVFGLIPHVRRIDGARRPQQLRQSHDFALGRRVGGRIPQPGGETDRAGVECLGKPRPHRLDLAFVRGAVERAHAADAQG